MPKVAAKNESKVKEKVSVKGNKTTRKSTPKTVKKASKKSKKKHTAHFNALKKLGFFTLAEKRTLLTVRKCLPTGIPGLDVRSARDKEGTWGFPFGRQIEISGKPDSGKTSLLIQIASQAQKNGYTVLWIETEYSLNRKRAENLKAKLDEFFVSTPETLEKAIKVIQDAVLTVLPAEFNEVVPSGESKGLVVLFDSIGSTMTEAEANPKKDKTGIEKDSPPADFARRMSKFQRKFLRMSNERDIMVVYANKLTDKIGVTFGKRTTTYGGNAIRYHCALRFEAVYTGKIKDKSGKILGMTMKIANVKNKCEMPWQDVDNVEFYFDGGFNKSLSLLDALTYKGLIKKTGPKYSGCGLDGIRKSDFCKLVDNDESEMKKYTDMLTNIEMTDESSEEDAEDENNS